MSQAVQGRNGGWDGVVPTHPYGHSPKEPAPRPADPICPTREGSRAAGALFDPNHGTIQNRCREFPTYRVTPIPPRVQPRRLRRPKTGAERGRRERRTPQSLPPSRVVQLSLVGSDGMVSRSRRASVRQTGCADGRSMATVGRQGTTRMHLPSATTSTTTVSTPPMYVDLFEAFCGFPRLLQPRAGLWWSRSAGTTRSRGPPRRLTTLRVSYRPPKHLLRGPRGQRTRSVVTVRF